jgi:predicted CXXCH cytochrome family protein
MVHKLKTLIRVLIVVAMLNVVSSVNAQSDSIVGSAHDLSMNGDIVGGLYACAYCHGAHGSEGVDLPLWNRSTPISSFTLYTSTTISTVASPGVASTMCLSCHDGVTAFDALNGDAGTPGNNMATLYLNSTAIVGSDLRNDHPVGVSISADSLGIYNEQAITDAGLKVYDGKVECGSCHDAHGSDGYTMFLRISNSGSTMCTTCHNK